MLAREEATLHLTEPVPETVPGGRNLLLYVFLFAVAVMLLYRLLGYTEEGDSAIYDYIAQTILRGQLPYRDVVDVKWPAASYISALAMLAGRAVGVRDIIASRVMNILLVGIMTAATYEVARLYLRSRGAALIASLIPLLAQRFPVLFIVGTQPKLPMAIFGLISLIMIAKDRPFTAGVFSMLACLSWQPGLLFTGTAFLIFSRYLTSWRDLKAARVLAGALLPFAVLVIYFGLNGIIRQWWGLTIDYNYNVMAPQSDKPLGWMAAHIWKVSNRVMGHSIIFFFLAVAGAMAFSFGRVRGYIAEKRFFRSPDLFRDALLIPPAVYAVFCTRSFQAGPDLIPFLPFLGIFAAWLIVLLTGWVSRREWAGRSPARDAWIRRIPALIAGVLAVTAVYQSLTRPGIPGPSIQEQDRIFTSISSLMRPGDKIYVHGTAEVLVLLDLPNLNPLLFVDARMDEYVAKNWYGRPFREVIEEMDRQEPRIVCLSRLTPVEHAEDFRQWVREKYEKVPDIPYDVYVRKQER